MSDTNTLVPPPAVNPAGILPDFVTLANTASAFHQSVSDSFTTLSNINKALEDHYDAIMKEIELTQNHAINLVQSVQANAAKLITAIQDGAAENTSAIHTDAEEKISSLTSAAKAIAAMLKDLNGPLQQS